MIQQCNSFCGWIILLCLVLPGTQAYSQSNFQLNGGMSYVLGGTQMTDGRNVVIGIQGGSSPGPRMVCFDNSGNVSWYQEIQSSISTAENSISSVITFPDSTLIMSRFFNLKAIITKYDHNGNPIWQYDLGRQTGGDGKGKLFIDSDSTFYYAGEDSPQILSSEPHAYAAKMKTDGTLLWERRFSVPSGVYDNMTTQKSGNGNITLVGTAGSAGIVFLELNSQGNLIGSQRWNISSAIPSPYFGQVNITGSAPTQDGNILLTGRWRPSGGSGDRFWVSKISPSGNLIWSNYYQPSTFLGSNQVADKAFEKPNGNIVVSGFYYDTPSSSKLAIMEIDSLGNFITGQSFNSVLHLGSNEIENDIFGTSDGGIVVPSRNKVFKFVEISDLCGGTPLNMLTYSVSSIPAFPFTFTPVSISPDLSSVNDTTVSLNYPYPLECVSCAVSSVFSQSASSVCTQDSVVFNAPGAGGVTYTWLVNGSAQGSGPVFTWVPNDTGNVEIKLIAGGSTCSDTSSSVITVSGFPNLTANGPSQVCEGASPVSLSANIQGGSWSGTGVSGNSFDPVVGPGVYHPTYQISGGGCSASDSVLITVTPLPDATISPVIPACTNDPIVGLSAATPGGTWSGQGVSGSSFDPAIGAGNYQVNYLVVDSNGCSAQDSLSISVLPLPDASIDSVGPLCTVDPPAPLTAATPGGVWSGQGVVGSNFDPSVGVGFFQVLYSVTDSNGCSAEDSIEIEVEVCIGVDERKWSSNIAVWPNPFKNQLIIEPKLDIMGLVQVEVQDLKGRKIERQEFQDGVTVGNAIHISLPDLPSGLYLLKVWSPIGHWQTKLLHQ